MIYPDGEKFWVKLQSVFTDECIDGYPVRLHYDDGCD